MSKRVEKKPEHWSDIVGMPDDWDKRNITALINKFKRRKFEIEGQVISGALWIQLEVADAKRQHDQEIAASKTSNRFNLKIKDSDARGLTAIPNALFFEIQEAYPTMFRDKDHYYWFCRNFREFLIPDKV